MAGFYSVVKHLVRITEVIIGGEALVLGITDGRVLGRIRKDRSNGEVGESWGCGEIGGGVSLERSGGGGLGDGPGPDRLAGLLLLLVELPPPALQALQLPGDLLPAATDDVLEEVLKLFLFNGVGLGQLAEVSGSSREDLFSCRTVTTYGDAAWGT